MRTRGGEKARRKLSSVQLPYRARKFQLSITARVLLRKHNLARARPEFFPRLSAQPGTLASLTLSCASLRSEILKLTRIYELPLLFIRAADIHLPEPGLSRLLYKPRISAGIGFLQRTLAGIFTRLLSLERRAGSTRLHTGESACYPIRKRKRPR